MVAKAALVVISSVLFDAQATWEDKPAWADWEEAKPDWDGGNASWSWDDFKEWAEENGKFARGTGCHNSTRRNRTREGRERDGGRDDRGEGRADHEPISNASALVAGSMSVNGTLTPNISNRSVFLANPMPVNGTLTRNVSNGSNFSADPMSAFGTLTLNLSNASAFATDLMSEGNRNREEPGSEPEYVFGTLTLGISNPSTFAADPLAKGIVRAVLAEIAGIPEENVFVHFLAAANRTRRLTAPSQDQDVEEGTLNVRYKIHGESLASGDFDAIAAALRGTSGPEVVRACRAHLQEAGLPYEVDGAHFTRIELSGAHAREEAPCEQSEFDGHLRGRQHPRNCTPSSGSNDAGCSGVRCSVRSWLWFALGLTLLCVAVTLCVCIYRKVTRQQGPKLIVVLGPPCTGSPSKKPEQGVIVSDNVDNNDNNNDNNINGIVMGHVVGMGHVVLEPSTKGGLAQV